MFPRSTRKQAIQRKWIEFRVKHKKLHKFLIRVEVIWWAICGRPIIYKVNFTSGVTLDKSNQNVLIAENKFL